LRPCVPAGALDVEQDPAKISEQDRSRFRPHVTADGSGEAFWYSSGIRKLEISADLGNGWGQLVTRLPTGPTLSARFTNRIPPIPHFARRRSGLRRPGPPPTCGTIRGERWSRPCTAIPTIRRRGARRSPCFTGSEDFVSDFRLTIPACADELNSSGNPNRPRFF
jgi:hypothetical protein